MLTLKEVFDESFSHVKFNKNLCKEFYTYQLRYINQNSDHLEFFGSNLLGVHVLRFKDSDVNRFYDILDIDFHKLTANIRKVDTISHEFKVGHDVLNLTLMYVIHRLMIESGVDNNTKSRAAYDVALIFFYRCIAALMSYYFRYPSDPKIAQKTYANLSNKFLIKKLGSWHKVMDYRTKDLVTKDGLHYNTLLKFNDDIEVQKAIADAQGRVKDLVKNYTQEFYRVHEGGESIATTSSTFLDAEGEETVKEKTKSVEALVTYIRNTINDKPSFIKDDLISIIVRINANTSFRMVKSTLAWLSDNYNEGQNSKEIDEFVSLTIVQSLYFIQNNIDVKHMRDYPHILINLKNLYLSTRTVDQETEKVRDLGLKLIKKSTKGISLSLALSTRTSVILYLTLRALVGNIKI